ncbi:suppressor of fused domain protein [Clostridium estertheticum]|uniref:Suppressor of fused-like domain-containing protein n=1 Tax=Clostridium estertheticum subsp. estertheticum TaxID=1552 RepID=A0A1J0GGA7_9CLOT|nr:suppressor of fused domain protein [Clostridium estertheticum]APC40349.1 hypothetical protein A7L45_09865 [Clostridium estertheticum subsp. estertheticum]MBU3174475.1 suppressor of fused domain protein [Clostridium estertheticum]MBZ9617835.1 suppressor of fused domain protein [Clostridium estertheticum subsp. laramiense]WAG73501.1 suppressor of fused domain protein [Clostridium estertheticum]
MSDLSWIQVKRDIFDAISKGDLETLINMVERYPKVITAYNVSSYSLLHVAAEQNNKDILEFLYRKGLDVNITRKNDGGCVTPIHGAVNKNLIENVIWLLNHGANVDTGLRIHATPLIGAAFNGSEEMVKVLLKAGATIDAFYYVGEGKTKTKINAIVAAEMEGHSELARYLREHDAIEDTLDEDTESIIESQHDEILCHLEKYFGKVTNTLSEIVPGSKVAVSVNIIPNSSDNKFITIATTGMSDCPMDDSVEAFEENFAELIIKLPISWPISKNDMNDMNNYWPLGWIRKTAHIPHLYNGWIGKDIIFPNGDPAQPFASNTKLSCIMVCKPKESGLDSFVSTKGNIINFYTIIPIYEEERNIALEKGCEYLIRKLSKRGIVDVLDATRENVGL